MLRGLLEALARVGERDDFLDLLIAELRESWKKLSEPRPYFLFLGLIGRRRSRAGQGLDLAIAFLELRLPLLGLLTVLLELLLELLPLLAFALEIREQAFIRPGVSTPRLNRAGALRRRGRGGRTRLSWRGWRFDDGGVFGHPVTPLVTR